MVLKYLHWLGILAGVALIVSCFLPWAYYADINQTFTGFYSFKNNYGKPGKILVVCGTLAIIFMLLPKVWAKRFNLFLCALIVAYAIKTYILFTSCYNNYCPQKLVGIYVMLLSSFVMMCSAVFPNVRIMKKSPS